MTELRWRTRAIKVGVAMWGNRPIAIRISESLDDKKRVTFTPGTVAPPGAAYGFKPIAHFPHGLVMDYVYLLIEVRREHAS